MPARQQTHPKLRRRLGAAYNFFPHLMRRPYATPAAGFLIRRAAVPVLRERKVVARGPGYDGFFSAGSRWMGSTHNTFSGFSTGSMSRLTAIASPSLRTSTHSSTWSGLALIS